MFEKVNPSHPDKIADRIAGAIIDLAYSKSSNPKCAVEVLVGHGSCTIIIETSEKFTAEEIHPIVQRITENSSMPLQLLVVPQDPHLAKNQREGFKCGDNGIFKGVPVTDEEKDLASFVRDLYTEYPYDGKFILNKGKLTICQSRVSKEVLEKFCKNKGFTNVNINPLGDWTGGLRVDSGATNRKLGSDMAQSITGGGLHGKDLSKADVSVNIYAFLKAQETGRSVEICCDIGDDTIDGKPYSEIVELARDYIKGLGGFEAFAEYGLV